MFIEFDGNRININEIVTFRYKQGDTTTDNKIPSYLMMITTNGVYLEIFSKIKEYKDRYAEIVAMLDVHQIVNDSEKGLFNE